MRHCDVIFATSFWFAESFSFSVSVKSTGIDPIAVLADSKNTHLEQIMLLRFIHQDTWIYFNFGNINTKTISFEAKQADEETCIKFIKSAYWFCKDKKEEIYPKLWQQTTILVISEIHLDVFQIGEFLPQKEGIFGLFMESEILLTVYTGGSQSCTLSYCPTKGVSG